MLNNIAATLVGGVIIPPTDYESIATTTVGAGGAASITFSSIPSTYKHLQLRILGRGSAGSFPNTAIQLNGDTGANYRVHYLGADGASTFAGDFGASQTSANTGWLAGSSQAVNVFGVSIVDILDYSETTKNKTIRAIGGCDNNGSGLVGLWSGLWLNTGAVSSIVMSPAGGSWVQYSQIALYGVK